MNVDQRPDLGLQQHLHLTTELKQGIAILRMSAQELSEYARKCVEENPFFDDDDWVEPRHPLAPERYSQDVSADALFEKRGHGSPETFDAERSDLSQRSFSFDRFLAEGDTLEGFTERTHMVVEGALACRTLKTLADATGVELPITDVVRSVVWEGADPRDVAKTLTSRPLTTEFYGL